MSLPIPPPRPVSSRRRQAGIGLLDTLFALVLLAVGLLAQSAAALGEHNLAEDQGDRTQAHQAVRQFVERLRADEDWPSLFNHLAIRQMSETPPKGPAYVLDDGRTAFPPTDYYADFTCPPQLETPAVLVEVPLPPVLPGLPVLREDVAAPAFELPADLNGDGVVDSAARNADYVALPIRVTFRWSRVDGRSREITMATWLRGER